MRTDYQIDCGAVKKKIKNKKKKYLNQLKIIKQGTLFSETLDRLFSSLLLQHASS
jgi:hypothetical protein